MAVLLKSGTKRTVPSRWPDALLVDLKAPRRGAPRDEPGRLRGPAGDVDRARGLVPRPCGGHGRLLPPAPISMLREQGQGCSPEPPACAGRAGDVRPARARAYPERDLPRDRRKDGPALGHGAPGEPPDRHGRRRTPPSLVLHGAQVAVAAVPVAAAWEAFLAEFDPPTWTPTASSPTQPPWNRWCDGVRRHRPSGRVGESAGTTTAASSSDGRIFGRGWKVSSRTGHSTGRS